MDKRVDVNLRMTLTDITQEDFVSAEQQDFEVAKILGDIEPQAFYSLDLNAAIGLIVSQKLTLGLNCYTDGDGYFAKVGNVTDFEIAESLTHPADAIIKAWLKWKNRDIAHG